MQCRLMNIKLYYCTNTMKIIVDIYGMSFTMFIQFVSVCIYPHTILPAPKNQTVYQT